MGQKRNHYGFLALQTNFSTILFIVSKCIVFMIDR